jgi:chromosome segregation ATPase
MNLVHQFFLWLSTLAHRGSSAALDLLVAHARLWPDPLAIATERAKAARRHAEDTAQQCDAYLTQTSNVPPAPEAQTLAARLAAIEVQIEKARADIEAAMGITEQRQRVRDIAAGKLAPDYRRYMEFTKEEADRAFLAGHRKKLAELAAIDVPAAEQTVTRCQQEAAAARARLAELEAKRRELQLRPESMSWQP